MKQMRLTLLILLLALAFFSPTAARQDSPLALVLTAKGPIMPPMLEYIQRGIKTAERKGAEVLIIELDTPGGSLATMSEIISAIGKSRTPVVIYITPKNAQAASAGALITMSAQVAVMTPGTVIGAASPVDSSGGDIETTMQKKIMEDMKAQARNLVSQRGTRAARLAESMIEDAAAVTAEEALEAGLIDFLAKDTADLLQKLNGRKISLHGENFTFETANIETQPLGMSFIEEFLLLLTDPNIAFLLLAIGAQAILIELSSPGGWAAGFLGAACITLAVYGMGVLPINWFGIVFLVIAFVLFILDIKAAAHGALTTAGVASFIVGALVLFNSPGTPEFQRVSVPLVVGAGIFIGLVFFTIMIFALRARRGRIQVGAESLPGKTGIARQFEKDAGQVQLDSELWSAEKSADSAPIRKGDSVEVVEIRGLRLIVKKK